MWLFCRFTKQNRKFELLWHLTKLSIIWHTYYYAKKLPDNLFNILWKSEVDQTGGFKSGHSTPIYPSVGACSPWCKFKIWTILLSHTSHVYLLTDHSPDQTVGNNIYISPDQPGRPHTTTSLHRPVLLSLTESELPGLPSAARPLPGSLLAWLPVVTQL